MSKRTITKRFTADLDNILHERLYLIAHLRGHKDVVKYFRELINQEFEKLFAEGDQLLRQRLDASKNETPNFSEHNLC
jgi:hypothetical protein